MNLQGRAKKWREVARATANGPLVIAGDVCEVLRDWEAYKEQADGMTATAWLRTVFGSGKERTGYWQRRAEAVEVLGESVRRNLHHSVAVWVCSTVPAPQRAACVRELTRACAENSGIPLEPKAARRRVSGIWESRRGGCASCAALRERVAELEEMLAAQRAAE